MIASLTQGKRQMKALLLAIALFTLIMGGVVFFQSARPTHAASEPITTLLVHGFSVGQTTCDGSATYQDLLAYLQQPHYVPELHTNVTWASTRSQLVTIGHYNNDIGCDQNLGKYTQCDGGGYLNDDPFPFNSADVGTTNEGINHLGCRLAWFIYDSYTVKNIPVDIIAHSMGGLMVREAIAYSGSSSAFPPALDVRTVITLGTPHDGLGNIAGAIFNGATTSTEVLEMTASPLDSTAPFYEYWIQLSQYASHPQGRNGTKWALLGSEGIDTPGFGAGDGIVTATSSVYMPADFKFMYDIPTYHHQVIPGISPPFLLANDGNEDGQNAQGYICISVTTCLETSPDPHDPSQFKQMIPYYHAFYVVFTELEELGIPLPPPPTPTMTPKPALCKTQPNDTNCDNQDYIQQGCNSYPQSQVYNDSVINITLYYSTNCQSNWTWGKIQSNQTSNYTIVKEDIERGATLQEPSTSLTETVNNTSWYTNMLWAPNSPTRSCAWYKNNSSGAVSNQLCTPWSISCLVTPNDANCDNQSSVAQGCNDYPQTSPPPVDNGYVTVTVHYSTNCQSNWAVATLDQQGTLYVIDTITINRAAVSGGDGAASYSATTDNNNSRSPMVWAPSNPVQGCVQWTNTQSFHTYTTCTNTQ